MSHLANIQLREWLLDKVTSLWLERPQGYESELRFLQDYAEHHDMGEAFDSALEIADEKRIKQIKVEHELI